MQNILDSWSVSEVNECIRRETLSYGRHYNKPEKSLDSLTLVMLDDGDTGSTSIAA